MVGWQLVLLTPKMPCSEQRCDNLELRGKMTPSVIIVRVARRQLAMVHFEPSGEFAFAVPIASAGIDAECCFVPLNSGANHYCHRCSRWLALLTFVSARLSLCCLPECVLQLMPGPPNYPGMAEAAMPPLPSSGISWAGTLGPPA
jgi:hypothetical protein